MATYTLTGTCYDFNGDVVPAAVVHIFDTATDTEQAQVTANGSGVYIANALTIAGPLYAVAYHAGSPDIAGTTLNTLTATLNEADSITVPVGALVLSYSAPFVVSAPLTAAQLTLTGFAPYIAYPKFIPSTILHISWMVPTVSSFELDAPIMVWVSDSSDATPDFDITIPDNALAGDVLRIEWAIDGGEIWTEYLVRTLDSDDIIADEIEVSADLLPDDDYVFRARQERVATFSDWSTPISVTIGASGVMIMPAVRALTLTGTAPTVGIEAGSFTATVWDAANRSTNQVTTVMSNGDLTVEETAGIGLWGGIRSIGSFSGTEKLYWEITVDNKVGDMAFGITDGSGLPAAGGGPDRSALAAAPSAHNVALFGGGGALLGGANQGTFTSAWTTGSVIRFKFDVAARQLFMAVGTDAFSAALNVVDSGVGHYGPLPPYHVAGWTNSVGGKFTANFGATAFVHGLPTGYTGVPDTVAPMSTPYEKFISRLPTADINTTHRNAYQALLNGLLTDGILQSDIKSSTKLDAIWIEPTQTEVLSKMNIIASRNMISKVGTPVFTPDTGWVTDGSNYLLDNMIPTDVGMNATPTSLSFGVWNDAAGTGQRTVSQWTVDSGSHCIFPSFTDNNAYFRNYGDITVASTTAAGFWASDRSGTTTKGYKNGSEVASGSSAAPGALPSGAAVRQGTDPILAHYAGAHLTAAEHVNLYLRLSTFIQTIAAKTPATKALTLTGTAPSVAVG